LVTYTAVFLCFCKVSSAGAVIWQGLLGLYLLLLLKEKENVIFLMPCYYLFGLVLEILFRTVAYRNYTAHCKISCCMLSFFSDTWEFGLDMHIP